MPIAKNTDNKYKKEVFDAICKKGKKCGEICIPKSNTCHSGKSDLKTPSVNQSGGISTPVIAGLTGTALTLGTGAIAGGSAMAIASKLRKEYIEGFSASGEIAKKQAELIKAPKLDKSVNTAIFAVGGFGTEDAFSESKQLQKNIESLELPGLHVEPIEYSKFNVRKNPLQYGLRESALESLGLLVDTVSNKKHNPVAREVAAKVIAYQKANPNVQFQLIGHSGGGLTIQESNEILNSIGIKVRSTAIGSPDLGLIPGKGDIVTTTSNKDLIVKKVSMGKAVNQVDFNNVAAHDQNSYFADPDFRAFMKDRIGLSRKDSNDKPECKEGKPCGSICIPKKSTCQKEKSDVLKSPAGGKSLRVGGVISASAIAAGASLLGVPTSAYLVQKTRFQNGFSSSADLAKEQSKTYDVPNNIKSGYRSVGDQDSNSGSKTKSRFTDQEPEQVTFFAGGIGGVKGLEADYMGQHFARMFPNHHVVGIETPEQEVLPQVGDHVASPSYLSKVFKATLGDNLKKGRSDVAVRIAARAYAYSQKYPDKPINLVGQSGGGMPAREAYEILDKMGVKDVKVVTAGSPYFGLTRPSGITLTDPKNDPVHKMYGVTMPGKANVSIKGHSQYWSEVPYKQLTGGKWVGEVDNNAWDNAVPNQSVKQVVSKYLDRTKKDSVEERTDANDINKTYLEQLFKVLISRAYNGAIAKVGKLTVTPDNAITGMFLADKKTFSFLFKNEELTYKLTKTNRTDSLITVRFDKTAKRKKCKIGISCGSTCISSSDTCKLKSSQLASPTERIKLKQAIARFKLAQEPASVAAQTQQEDYIINPETKQPYTIRELRKVAAQKGVVGYGSMPMDEMRQSIKLVDRDPESARRITAGVVKKRSIGTKAISASGLSGRSKNQREAKRNLKDVVTTNKRLEALIKFTGSAPVAWSAAAVGAFLLGVTIRTYERTKESYREGFDESARLAEERAVKLNLRRPRESNGEVVKDKNGKVMMSSYVPQDNITFAVGSGKSQAGEEIKELLQREKNPEGNKAEHWFASENYVIPFNLKEGGVKKRGNTKHQGDILDGVKSYLKNFKRKTNQDAVDLASEIYAYGIASPQDNPSRLMNKYKKINILAHGIGGQTTKEALEILSRMEVRGKPTGKEVLKQVNAVYLGTPHFGFAENVSKRQRTIMSAQDPMSNIPNLGSGARLQWISSVKGHSVKEYLDDVRVRDAIREAFGYYEASPSELERREKKRIAAEMLRKEKEREKIEQEKKTQNDSAYTIQFQTTVNDIIHLDKKPECSPKSKPCGDICIPKANECHKNSSPVSQSQNNTSSLIAKGLGAGLIAGGIGLASAHVAKTINVSKTPASKLSLLTQKEVDQLTPTGNKPQQGATGKIFFVKDKSGKRSLFKEIHHPLNYLQASAEAIVSDIAKEAGINTNEVKLVPAKLKTPLKEGRFGASLHSVVPGKTLTDVLKDNPISPYSLVNIKQENGLGKGMIDSLGKHPDLAKLAALDTFTGNWDRKNENLFYDSSTDSFHAIDNGNAFSRTLAKNTYNNLKNLDTTKLSPEEIKGLKTYNETLKKLYKNRPPKKIKQDFTSYLSQEKGSWNALRRYAAIRNIDSNYRSTKNLIDLIDLKLEKTTKKDAYDVRMTSVFDSIAKGKKCGQGYISKSKDCLKGNNLNQSSGDNKNRDLLNLSGAALAIAAGVGVAHVAGRINSGGMPKFELSITSQKEIDGLKETGKPSQGKSSRTLFVADKDNNKYVLKENNHPLKLLEASSEALASEIGRRSGINVPVSKVIPSSLKTDLIKGRFGGSLHSLVPGSSLRDRPIEEYKDVDIKQQSGFNQKMITSIAKHPDLAEIAALDTYTGNWDRNTGNLMYDAKEKRFSGIDNGLAFSRNLAGETNKNLKDLDATKLSNDERKGLSKYLETLKTLHRKNNPRINRDKLSSYLSQEGGKWNIYKRYVNNTAIKNSHSDTEKLIKMLETKLSSK